MNTSSLRQEDSEPVLRIGDVVVAEVTNVQVFGIFCKHGTQELLVRIPEVSWIASFNSCLQVACPGDHLTVKIIHIDEASLEIAATIKGLFPDPWQTDQLQIGTTHTATVVRYVDKSDRCGNNSAYMLQLLPGSFVMMGAKDLLLQIGQNLYVTISDSQPHTNSVRVVPASQGSEQEDAPERR
jgi:predicted RNA-binding protein with RPS1 domain